MKVKALTSLVGETTMNTGEVKDLSDDVAKSLIEAKFVEAVEAEKPKPKKTTKK